MYQGVEITPLSKLPTIALLQRATKTVSLTLLTHTIIKRHISRSGNVDRGCGAVQMCIVYRYIVFRTRVGQTVVILLMTIHSTDTWHSVKRQLQFERYSKPQSTHLCIYTTYYKNFSVASLQIFAILNKRNMFMFVSWFRVGCY